MAIRPWVTPQEVRDYSDRQSVKDRTDAKLAIDISRAEQYVIAYTHNTFADEVQYPVLPEPVKTAVILISESYAADAAALGAGVGEFKSESFDDYAYTMADSAYKLSNLGLGALLDEYIEDASKGKAIMKMRKL